MKTRNASAATIGRPRMRNAAPPSPDSQRGQGPGAGARRRRRAETHPAPDD
jgi:hypothetical protein